MVAFFSLRCDRWPARWARAFFLFGVLFQYDLGPWAGRLITKARRGRFFIAQYYYHLVISSAHLEPTPPPPTARGWAVHVETSFTRKGLEHLLEPS
jgi:hypothetical protein